MVNEQNSNGRRVTNLVATFSVTFLGDDQRPMVASRITVDGQQADVPFAIVLGDGSLRFAGVPQDNLPLKISFSQALQQMALSMAAQVIGQAKQLASQQEGAATLPPPPPSNGGAAS